MRVTLAIGWTLFAAFVVSTLCGLAFWGSWPTIAFGLFLCMVLCFNACDESVGGGF